MPKYCRKPVIVEAVQWWKDGDHPRIKTHPHKPGYGAGQFGYGLEAVVPGDWIVGDYDLVPDHIFKKTYELLEDQA